MAVLHPLVLLVQVVQAAALPQAVWVLAMSEARQAILAVLAVVAVAALGVRAPLLRALKQAQAVMVV